MDDTTAAPPPRPCLHCTLNACVDAFIDEHLAQDSAYDGATVVDALAHVLVDIACSARDHETALLLMAKARERLDFWFASLSADIGKPEGDPSVH